MDATDEVEHTARLKSTSGDSGCLAIPARLLSVTSVKVSSKNQIAVPAAVRRRLGIRPGDRLSVAVKGGRIVLEPQPHSVVDEMASLAPEVWRGVDAVQYVRELRDE